MHVIQSAASSESEPIQEDSTVIRIGADARHPSNRLHEQRLFGLHISPSVITTTRAEIQQPLPSYEEASDPNGKTFEFFEGKEAYCCFNIGLSFTFCKLLHRLTIRFLGELMKYERLHEGSLISSKTFFSSYSEKVLLFTDNIWCMWYK